MLRAAYLTITLVVAGLLALGCSGTGYDYSTAPNITDTTANSINHDSQRILWGVWNIKVDADELTIAIEPIRNVQAHFDITDMLLPPSCDDCLIISVNSFDPISRILDADVTLRNPAQVNGYDVRGILYTNNYGHELRNGDDWTGLWDITGGGLINPFKAFAKDEENRVFASEAEHTENYLVYIPIPPNWDAITLAIDASWPGNCEEPYEIINFWQETIEETPGSSGNIHIDVRDWQDDVSKVTLVAPVITGEQFTLFSHLAGDTWILELTNSTGISAGQYSVRIIANSLNSGDLVLYDFVNITISETTQPPTPIEVTPPWLNMGPKEVFVEGNIACIAGYTEMHFVNVSDSGDPVWLSKIDMPEEAYGWEHMVRAGDYFYIIQPGVYSTGDDPRVVILQLNYPNSINVVKIVTLIGDSHTPALCLEGDYLYAVEQYAGCSIIDIDPPESASIIKTIKPSYTFDDFTVEGGYAYAVGSYQGLQIFDIDPPEDASQVNSVLIDGIAEEIEVFDGYAYVADWHYSGGLYVVDVDPPESAAVVSEVEIYFIDLMDLQYHEGYLYALVSTTYEGWLYVFDVSTPESANLVQILDSPSYFYSRSTISGDNMFIISPGVGVHIFDISQPDSPDLVNTIYTIGEIDDVVVRDGYAYAVGDYTGLNIVDVTDPGSANLIKKVLGEPGLRLYRSRALAVSGECAYVIDRTNTPSPITWGKMNIIDIEPPESAYTIGSIDTPESPVDIEIYGNYAYLADWYFIHIIDISSPEPPKTWWWKLEGGVSKGLKAHDGYLYLAHGARGLKIFDLENPTDLVMAGDVPIGTHSIARKVDVAGGYAYYAFYDAYTKTSVFGIADVDPPGSASVINVFYDFEKAVGVTVYGDYAYVADKTGIRIVDINPPESAYIYDTLELGGKEIAISDGYAYVVAGTGLRILKLW